MKIEQRNRIRVDVSKLDETELMALGATLPGKLYRVSENETCVVGLFSVTKTTKTKGFFSSESTKVLELSQEIADIRKDIVDGILSSMQEHSEFFQSVMDEKKNVNLSALATSTDATSAEKARTAIKILDASCE